MCKLFAACRSIDLGHLIAGLTLERPLASTGGIRLCLLLCMYGCFATITTADTGPFYSQL